MSGNGGDNAHNSAFGGGKNPGMGNTGSGSHSGSSGNGGHTGNNDGSYGGGMRAPTASEVAGQFNSYGGTQISASQVSNIRSDGNGGYSADIKGQINAVSSGGESHTSNTVGGFSGVSTSGHGSGGSGGNSGSQPGSNNPSAGNGPGGVPTTWDRTANYYSSSDQVSRKALKNMYEEAVRTGNIPAAARGSLRANVQAMLDEDKRLADARAAAEAEQRRLAAEAERQRQAYDAAVKADAGAMAQAAAALKSAEDARLAAENALQGARSRQASIGNLPGTWDRTANYYSSSDQVSRKALKNMYEKAVSTGSIPAAARGNLREKVQAMLDEDNRLANTRAAADADVQRLTIVLSNAQQAVVTAQKQQADTIAQAAEKARQRQAEEAERQRQAVEAAEKAKNEREALEKTSELIAGMGEKIGQHLGDKYTEVAKGIARDIKNFQGKTIRSFDDAMASLNKITANPDLKINQADKDALVNAWKQVDAQDMANKLGNLSKAFKVTDVAMKVEKVREKSIVGYETGNWGPLMLEVESWVLSGLASTVALGIFSATLGAYALSLGSPAIAVGIAGILLAAAVGAFIDDKFADALNNEIIRPAH